jgi:hypothetical protein
VRRGNRGLVDIRLDAFDRVENRDSEATAGIEPAMRRFCRLLRDFSPEVRDTLGNQRKSATRLTNSVAQTSAAHTTNSSRHRRWLALRTDPFNSRRRSRRDTIGSPRGSRLSAVYGAGHLGFEVIDESLASAAAIDVRWTTSADTSVTLRRRPQSLRRN